MYYYVHTCSSLVALSLPSNVQNFISTPPPISSDQLHKYHEKMSPLNVAHIPPNKYGINYLDFN